MPGVSLLPNMFENTDFKTILPLIGVAIGWLLSETSHIWRSRKEQKKLLGKVVLKLLELRAIVARELDVVSIAKAFTETKQLTDEDQRLLADMDNEAANFLENLDSLLSEIATVDPLRAYKVEHDLRSIHKLMTVGRGYLGKSKNPKFWQGLFIKVEEQVYKDLLAEMRKSILKLARRKSLLLWLRAWFFFRNEKNNPTEIGNIMKQAKETLEPFNT